MPKQNKMGHKVCKNTIEFMLYWPAALGMGPALSIAEWDSIGENRFVFPLPVGSIAIASWLGMGAHVAWTHAGPVRAVPVSGWRVHQSCCTWKALPGGHLSPLALTVFLPPLSHRSWSLEGSALMKSSHWGLSVPKPFTPCTQSTR